MNKSKDKITYFAYVRKSSEGKERQALSIPAQKDKLNEQFGELDIKFIEESKSAFKPHNRPAFADMLERIHKGERVGLIAWHPDRLSRNEVDAGSLTHMIRTGVIEDLKLATYHFENTPEGIWMLQMALSQSQYESAKKGRDVKRGLEKKAQLGIYPAPAPLGYVNDKYAESGDKTVLIDEDRFDLCRKMVDMILTGNYTPPQILKIVTEEWGMTGQRGKKISRSNIYNLFTRPFYYGEFEYPVGSGKWYKGIHKKLMTREEYDRIQGLLGRKSTRPKQHTHTFTYRGPLRCGECGAMVTAERKTKRQKNGNVHHYIYYHCTKRANPNCTQKAIREDKLEEQITAALAEIEIPPEFREWALGRLKEMNKQEVQDREAIYSTQKREYETCVRKVDNLIDMRANEEITEEEFTTRKQTLLHAKERYQELLQDTDKRVENWLEVAERGFNFAEKASAIFAEARENNDLETQKEIFSCLGSDLLLKDRILCIDWDNLLFPIKSIAKEVRAVHDKLEPTKSVVTVGQMGEIYSQSPRMLPG